MNYVTIKNGVVSPIERKQLYYKNKPSYKIIFHQKANDGEYLEDFTIKSNIDISTINNIRFIFKTYLPASIESSYYCITFNNKICIGHRAKRGNCLWVDGMDRNFCRTNATEALRYLDFYDIKNKRIRSGYDGTFYPESGRVNITEEYLLNTKDIYGSDSSEYFDNMSVLLSNNLIFNNETLTTHKDKVKLKEIIAITF